MNAAQLLTILSGHQGSTNGISANGLAKLGGVPERRVRQLVSELREQGTAICATPETGYFIPTTPQELRQSCEFLEHRALKSLLLMSRMTNVSLATLMGQLSLNHG